MCFTFQYINESSETFKPGVKTQATAFMTATKAVRRL